MRQIFRRKEDFVGHLDVSRLLVLGAKVSSGFWAYIINIFLDLMLIMQESEAYYL